MTLRRQLFLAISLVFLVVFAGLLFLGVKSTRNYLEQQLGSHAQDAATSLALPLSQSLGKGDTVLARTQVGSVFDRGYFKRIVVISPASEVIITRELPEKIGDVPLWFTRIFPLAAPGGESFITEGWRQLGKVIVVSQPAFAYQYLWSTSREIAAWMLAAYLGALLLTELLLHFILSPLNSIERAANAIQQRRFEQIQTMPRARELARVVRAMNDMSRRISEILNAESVRAEGFRKQIFHDEVTGLDNRRSFDLRLNELLEGKEHISSGAVIALEVNHLKEFNKGDSYEHGDALLKGMAATAQEVLGPRAVISARLGGTAFAFVLVDVRQDEVAGICNRLNRSLQSQLEKFVGTTQDAKDVSLSLGGVYFRAGEKRSQIMARVDLAIEAARQAGNNEVRVSLEPSEELDTLGSHGWRDLILDAMHENRWILMGQPVAHMHDGTHLHQEVMLRLVDKSGHGVVASKFIPMATRHRFMADVDRAVVTLVLRRLQDARFADTAFAVNISPQSLEDRGFMGWLDKELTGLGENASRLYFEMSRYGCSLDLEAARQFAHLVRRHGAKFGIDRFGLDPHSLQTLRLIPPDYVKLDDALVGETGRDEAAVLLVNAIVTLARSMDVLVIAQGVETEHQATLLRDNHDYGQGYYFGEPTQFKD